MTIRRMLVPIDFSDASLQALQYASEIAAPFKAELIVIAVVEPLYNVGITDVYTTSGFRLQDQERAAARDLTRLAQRLVKHGIMHRTVVLAGVPYLQILGAAEKYRADLIVMATHGRTGLSRFLMGSVAEKVVRVAECPVLTLRVAKATRQRTKKRTK